MTAKRLFFVLLGSLVIVLAAMVGATYYTSTLLQAQAKQLATAKAKVEQLNTQQTGLAKSKRDITKYSQLEQVTKAVVPQDKDQAQTVREITNIAAANKISLTTINFPSSSLGAGVVATGTGAASSSAVASAASRAKPNLSQLTPVKGISGVYNLQITIGNNTNSTVSFTQLDNFLRSLENNRRTAAVSSINIQPQADKPNQFVFTLIINTYIKPS